MGMRVFIGNVLCCLLAFGAACAQEVQTDLTDEFVIDLIDVRDGLISNYVSKTASDADNLKYFATEGGISRYDGYSFKSYKPGETYPGLLNENIETLFRDSDNNIWIGTKSGGLSMLDISHNKITNYNHLLRKIKTERPLQVMSICQDANGYIWIGTWSAGVFVVDWKGGKLIRHFPAPQPILNIIRDRYDDIWFVSDFQLIRFSAHQKKFARFRLPYNMTNLVEDPSGRRIWMVGNSGRVVRLLNFQLSDQSVSVVPTDLSARYIRSIAIDNKKRVWLGSWGDGLFISDSTVSVFRKVDTTPSWNSIENVNHSIILDINIDKNQIAWLSTAHGGVLILYPNKGFKFVANNNNTGVKDRNVVSLCNGPGCGLLLGSLANGLMQKDGDQFTPVQGVPKARINTIKAYGDRLFVGTNEGLVIARGRDFENALRRFTGEKVTDVFLDSRDKLWVATQQTGLKVTNLAADPLLDSPLVYSQSGKGRFHVSNNRINKITEDQAGNVWIATYSGINRYDSVSRSFVSHAKLLQDTLPSVIVNDLLIKDNVVYLATPAGFVALQYQNDRLHLQAVYDSRSGLPNDFVCALTEDNNGNLWMSTLTSITRFDPFRKEFVSYDRHDGVMVNYFHIGSSFKDHEGNVYFGGANGAVSFNPDRLVDEFDSPDVVLTGVVVNNRSLQVGDNVDGRVLLSTDINFTDKLELGYKQNHITLTFAANDFFGADNIAYQYRLAGTNADWIDIGKRNEISFTRLGPGDYVLQVRASRERRNWGEPRSLSIVVDAPPWDSWYAYVCYFLIALGLGLLIRYVSTRQAKLEARVRIAEIEKAKEHDVNEAKIAFFTNISHEFRTPLTLILTPITEILSDLNLRNEFKSKMILVENNARRLLNLINQLLDFRKSEDGLLNLNVETRDFISFAKEVYLSFKDVSRTKNITYEFVSSADTAVLPFDADKMEIVLCNLLSNAFKYTRTNGKIAVRLSTTDVHLRVEVTDNGIGLSPEDAARIFDRFYQVPDTKASTMAGSGIGLAFTRNIVELHHGTISVRSVPGKGTCFTTRLLLHNPHLIGTRHPEKALSEIPAGDFDAHWLDHEYLDAAQDEKKKSVLVVDDNDDIRRYLRLLLQDEFKIMEAENGTSGLAIAKRELPDIIVSDIMMPEMDGIAFCQEIKSQVVTSHIPIILLTARTSVAFQVNGLETGADDYVTKPFNPLIMKTRIHNILDNRKKLRTYFLNKVRFEPDRVAGNESSIDDAFIERAIALVNENMLNEEFGVETMVEELCMSQSTLYRKIKSLTGLSITAFIRSVRLKKAAQLILSDSAKLREVAFQVGFNDYKHFRLSFHQQFGCLPSDYRSAMLQTDRNRERVSSHPQP